MTRNLLALALAWALGGCISLGGIKAPKIGGGAPVAVSAAPAGPACPGGLKADLQPQPKLPATAGFPQPVSPEERAATADYLTWLSTFATWARTGWARAAEAKTFCETK